MLYPNITYVIPAFNAAKTILATFSSIFSGNFKDGDEIIIVNDCSTDDTSKILADLSAINSHVRIIEHKVNKGSAAAGRNTAIEHSATPLIFCLDADNILQPNSVPFLVENLTLQKADCSTFGEIYYFPDSKGESHITHKWRYKEGTIFLADALAGTYWPGPSGNYLFTRDSWLKAGRYHESIGGAIDSWAFGIRQLAAGAKMVTTPDLGYLHRYGYESTYVRDSKKSNLSCSALQILIPLLDSIEESDVEYLLSKEGRTTWFDKLDSHPIRIKNQIGITGNLVNKEPEPYLLGMHYFIQQKYHDALEHFNCEANQNPNRRGLNYLRAECLFNLGQITESETAVRLELAILPKHPDALDLLKKIDTLMNDHAPQKNMVQVEALRHCIEGANLLEKGDPVGALKLLNHAYSLHCHIIGCSYARALCFKMLNKFPEAFEAVSAELKMNPTHQEAKFLYHQIRISIK